MLWFSSDPRNDPQKNKIHLLLAYSAVLNVFRLSFSSSSSFGGGDYILWALRKLIIICLANHSQNQRGKWFDCIRSPSAGERRCAAAWLQLCDLALRWNLEASQYNELYCMMGVTHDERRCRPDDPWLQYVYDLALRWELDHMIGNWMRPMHDDEKRSLHMRSEGQLPN
jgi:hypothetical protein